MKKEKERRFERRVMDAPNGKAARAAYKDSGWEAHPDREGKADGACEQARVQCASARVWDSDAVTERNTGRGNARIWGGSAFRLHSAMQKSMYFLWRARLIRTAGGCEVCVETIAEQE